MFQQNSPKNVDVRPNLVYTVAFDLPGWRGGRTMAKLLCSSLLRQFWSGKIIVFRNFAEPLFPVLREGLEEVFIETSHFGDRKEAGQSVLAMALEHRFRAADLLDPLKYGWIVYMDADCLALRNPDHLFEVGADVLIQPECGRLLRDTHVFNGYIAPNNEIRSRRNPWLFCKGSGINAGTFAVRSEHYSALMKQWRDIFESPPSRHSDMRDQTSFNKLLLETDLLVQSFPATEIQFPFTLNPNFLDYRKASLLHFVGGSQRLKIELAFALHLSKTYGDPGGLFLDIMES